MEDGERRGEEGSVGRGSGGHLLSLSGRRTRGGHGLTAWGRGRGRKSDGLLGSGRGSVLGQCRWQLSHPGLDGRAGDYPGAAPPGHSVDVQEAANAAAAAVAAAASAAARAVAQSFAAHMLAANRTRGGRRVRAAAGGRGALGAAASSFARGSSTGAAGGGVTDDGADRRLRSPCVGDNEAVDSCHSHQYAADRAGGGFAATSAPAASAAGGGFGAGFGDASAASVLEGGARTLSAAVHGAACMGVGMPGVMSAGGFPDAGAGFNAMGVAEHNHQQQPVKVKPVWKVTTVLAAAPPDPPASAGPFPPSGEGQALDLASDSGVPMVASAAASADGAAGYGGPMEAAAAVFPFEMHTPSLPPHPASAPPAGAAQPQHVGFTACLPGYAPAPALTATGVGDTSAAAAGATKCCWTVVNLTDGTTTHQPVVVGGVVGGGEHAGAASGGAACVDASPACCCTSPAPDCVYSGSFE